MALPEDLPEWATDPGASVVEPDQSRKEMGWEVDQAPPAGYFNWWKNLVYQWVVAFKDRDVEIKRAFEQSALASWSDDLAPNAGTNLSAINVSNTGVFCAVGPSGKVITGKVGVASVRTPAGSYADNINDVIYDPTLDRFFFCGDTNATGSEIQSGTNAALSVWTEQNNSPCDLRGIATDGLGNLVSVGNNVGAARIEINDSPALGASWSLATSAHPDPINKIAYGNGTFVAVGENGTIQYSTNRSTWTSGFDDSGADFIDVVYTEQRGFVAFRSTGFTTSPDGITWTDHSYAQSYPAIVAVEEGIYGFTTGSGATDFSNIHGFYTDFTTPHHSQICIAPILNVEAACFDPYNRTVWLAGNDGSDHQIIHSGRIGEATF